MAPVFRDFVSTAVMLSVAEASAAVSEALVDEIAEVGKDDFLEVADEVSEEEAPSDPKISAARSGFDERKAAARSPSGHPSLLHGLLLQQPTNGGSVFRQL